MTITTGTSLTGTNWYSLYPNYPEVVKEYYPVYYTNWINNENKTEKAFKIVNKLIELKLVNLDKVNDFVELTNKISEIL